MRGRLFVQYDQEKSVQTHATSITPNNITIIPCKPAISYVHIAHMKWPNWILTPKEDFVSVLCALHKHIGEPGKEDCRRHGGNHNGSIRTSQIRMTPVAIAASMLRVRIITSAVPAAATSAGTPPPRTAGATMAVRTVPGI